MRGNPQGEGGAGPGLAPELDITAMVGSDVLDDRQAQPSAAGGSAARLVDAEEPLENPFLVLGGYAQAAVSDGDLDETVR